MNSRMNNVVPQRRAGFKRVFSIFLISYLIMLILPTAGVLYLYRQVDKTAERNCAHDAIASISDVSASLRAQLSWMDSTASRFLLDSSMASMIHADPLEYGDTRVTEFNAFSKHLDDLIGTNEQNALGYRMLFQNSELVFYNSHISHGLEFVFNTTLHYEGMTYAEWYDAVFSSNQRKILPLHDIQLGSSTIRALTYNKPIVRGTAQSSRKAVLQFFIPESDLIPAQFDPLSSGYLIDDSGEILASFGAAAPFPVQSHLIQGTTGWMRQDGGLLAYTEVKNGMTLAVLIPEAVAFYDVIQMRGPMIFVFLLCAIVEGIMSWYLARRNARPIETLANNVNQMLNTPRRVNEFEYLQQSIIQLQQDRQTAQQAVSRNRQIETALLLNRLLQFRTDDADEILQAGDSIGIDLRASSYCVAIAAPPRSSSFAANVSLPEPPAGIRVIISEGQRNSLNLLYLCEGDNTHELTSRIRSHLQQLNGCMPQNTRIGLGRICSALDDVAFSFSQAVFCLQTDAPTGFVTQFDQIGPSLNSLHFPLDQQQRILNAVKHSNMAVIDQEFNTLIHENTVKRHLSSLLKRTLLSSIEALLLMAAEDTAQEENLSDYLRSIHQSNDFRTELEILRKEFQKIALRAGERYSQQSSNQSIEMQSYLEEHYSDSLLSIGSMAEHFGFSESYFSVLFKDLLGEPYSAYLEKLRLNKADEMLRSTVLSIEEVAQRVGYNNSTTFRRAYKRVKGISPLQFRNQKQE